MGFLKHLRSKSRAKSQDQGNQYYESPQQHYYQASNGYGTDYASQLDTKVLRRIFENLCPHATDRTCVSSEDSAVGDGCMLCDMRDLARSAQVSRKWYQVAQSLLYNSVRIDAVHYCEREAILSEKRNHQRKSFRRPSVNSAAAEDVPAARLSLFCRTVRASGRLAREVEYLKLPYMTRETSKGELAATVSALPNLKYVDLPEGVFNGDPTCLTLVNELQARCPQIRKMSYHHGSEGYLESLTRRHWQGLEELELAGVSVEPGILRVILSSLPALAHLSVLDLPWLGDTIFQSSPNLPEFPPLHSLTVEGCPDITGEGLKTYLDSPVNRGVLSSLHLRNTGVTVPSLCSFLFDAPHLHTLKIYASVSFTDTLPLATTPLLQSISLQELHFELTSSSHEGHATTSPAQSFYAYLCRSLHANALPALHSLHVRDPYFPDMLLLPPPPSAPNQRPSQLSTPLSVYAKGLDEQDPILTEITPFLAPQSTSNSDPGSSTPVLRSTGGRPLSAYNASRGLGPQWGGDSVVVGNGFGGFLAVPREDVPRPRSAGSDRATLLGPAFNAMSIGSPKGSISGASQGSGGGGGAVLGGGGSVYGGSQGGTPAGSQWGSPLLGHPNGNGGAMTSWSQMGSPNVGVGVGVGVGVASPNVGGGRGGLAGLVGKVGGGLKPAGAGKDRRKVDLWR
ncbi:Ribosomal RNA small subunit methyltransferase NEP1 [Sphaceloma murrayae]|uniref:Ribosomal RNA small subunit methyltransferase NEP1 n=1 Tax=Sphaceloma murrayae TaxID=2082308 RepID=A0A2K1QN46_9PEZI|nr:Ribosomal RNA small subunit methyltransferase NEP1 [Sphaceloma murrayae]